MTKAIDIFNKLKALTDIAQCEHLSFRFDGHSMIVHFMWGNNYHYARAFSPAGASDANFDVLQIMAEQALQEYREVNTYAKLDTRPGNGEVNP